MSKIANFETAPIEWDPSNVATCQIEFTQRERLSLKYWTEGTGHAHVVRGKSNFDEQDL